METEMRWTLEASTVVTCSYAFKSEQEARDEYAAHPETYKWEPKLVPWYPKMGVA